MGLRYCAVKKERGCEIRFVVEEMGKLEERKKE